MAAIPMLAYKVTDMSFHNALPDRTRLNLATRVSYSVKHTADGIARGEMKVTVNDKEKAADFAVNVSAVGVFRAVGLDRDAVHRETFRQLFPHLRALVTTLTANAGIPPILLPMMEPDGQNAVKVDFHPGGMPAEPNNEEEKNQ